VFKNEVLMNIFRPKRKEVAGELRRLHNKKLYDMYSSHNTVWVIKCRRMRWVGHVAYLGYRRGVYRVLVGQPERR
jgi:hypothetical protein